MGKAIMNYTIGIAVEKTLSEIQKRLGEFGIRGFMTDYHEDGSVKAIAFRCEVPTLGLMNFYMEPQILGVFNAIERNPNVPKPKRNLAQAARIAWRIERDSIFATLAKVEAKTASLLTAFLPYAQASSGATLGSMVEQGHFRAQLTMGGPHAAE